MRCSDLRDHFVCGKSALQERLMRIADVTGALLFGMLLASSGAHAQAYPDRPIKVIVPYAAGGAVDIVARTIGQPLSEALKQPVIVENLPVRARTSAWRRSPKRRRMVTRC